MRYKDYINLGFKRTDSNDSVEFDRTGYKGFSLENTINERILVAVSSGSLDEPILYIKKDGQELYHLIKISTDVVEDLFAKELESVGKSYWVGDL
jgi:hypothetical protein